MLDPNASGRPSNGERDAHFVGDEADDLRRKLEQIDKLTQEIHRRVTAA